MQSDRELLELAAKAAGPDVFGEPGCYFRRLSENHIMVSGWNPLTDDGDALRLAVKLRLPLQFDDWSDGETVLIYKGKVIEAENIVEQDPYAATRRAIVRAAAEIGRTL